MVHLRALLINHAQELNTRTREYIARERKVTSKLYRTSVHEFNSVVIGHHIYKTLWTPLIDEMLQVILEDTNGYNEYIITIIKRR